VIPRNVSAESNVQSAKPDPEPDVAHSGSVNDAAIPAAMKHAPSARTAALLLIKRGWGSGTTWIL